MKNILLAGATGYLGRYISQELVKNKYLVKVLVRDPQKFGGYKIKVDEVIKAEITEKSTLHNCCNNIDVVISTVGITKQKDGLTYKDVDYQANKNLLSEAKRSNVKKFIYVSVLNGDKLKSIKICEAKEMFVSKLKRSGMEYCIIRPNGFFSDMTEFFNMAQKGKAYLFGKGNQKVNPIHGEDLAKVCVSAIENKEKEIEVGGPEIFTHNEIASIAFDSVGKETNIVHIPDWIRKALLKMGRLFMSSKSFGPLEFFLNVMAVNMIAPKYGTHSLKDYYNSLSKV